MKRSSLRIAVVVALAGGAVGFSGLFGSAEAAPCTTEGTLGEVIVPGVGAVDVDTAPDLSGSVCVGVGNVSVEVFEAAVDTPFNYTDTAVRVCVSTPSDPACTYTSPAVAQVYAGVANEDIPAMEVTGSGAAVTLGHGTSYDTVDVTVMGQPVTTDVPRVCVEVGTGRCETADRIFP